MAIIRTLEPSETPPTAASVIYRLRAQLAVALIAFAVLSGIDELRQYYRYLVLETQDRAAGFLFPILWIVLLSIFIGFSSMITLHRKSTHGSPELAEPHSTAVIVAAISILPLLGLALGLWLAKPAMRDTPRPEYRPEIPYNPRDGTDQHGYVLPQRQIKLTAATLQPGELRACANC